MIIELKIQSYLALMQIIKDIMVKKKIGNEFYNLRTKPPLSVRVAIHILQTGKLPWWADWWLNLSGWQVGNLTSPLGTEYNGFKYTRRF